MPPIDAADDRKRALRALLDSYRNYVELNAKRPAAGFRPTWRFLDVPKTADAAQRAEIWKTVVDFADGLLPMRLPWLEGTTIEIRRPSELARQIYVGGDFDPNEFALLDAVLREGMTFVDIGANIGVYSLFAAKKVGPRGDVIAFEPSPREFSALAGNIALNRLANVRLHQVAVGLADSRARLKVAPPNYDGLNSFHRDLIAGTYPNIRYRTDSDNFVWASFNAGETRLPIKDASKLEIYIYSEKPFAFDLRQIRVESIGAVVGPWRMEVPGETPMAPPLAMLPGRSADCSASSVGAIRIIDIEGGVRVIADAGSGLMLRWDLDPSKSDFVALSGRPSPAEDSEIVDVAVVSLDSFLSGRPLSSVDVVKLDVEGGEADALAGAAALLRTHQPLILAELETGGAISDNSKRSAALLDELGYQLFDLSAGAPRPIRIDGIGGTNILAAPERFLDQVLRVGGLTRAALKAPDGR